MKRILLVMMQPPGSSGVQGLIYNKILPHLEANGWEFHFAGPSPQLTSILTEDVQCPSSRLHYTNNVSWSLRTSVLKNRKPKGSLAYYGYGFLQLASRLVEKLLRHDSRKYLISGLTETIKQAEAQWNFDLIAGKSPDFIVLEAVAGLTKSIHKPLVAMVNDPYGKRDGLTFVPYERQKQQQILDQCCGAMFMSPMTLDRYVNCGLVSREKSYAFTDSYPSAPNLYHSGMSSLLPPSGIASHGDDRRVLHLAHLGMLPEWRPIDALIEALEDAAMQSVYVQIDVFGYLYPGAKQLIQSKPQLRRQIRCNKPVCYSESHYVAEDASALMVVIGPRHLDNQPSKFFEYLGHHKPLLVLGPPGNPIQNLVEELNIGVYCDILSPRDIVAGIIKLSTEYGDFVAAFKRHKDAISVYSAAEVARHWADCLNSMHVYSSSSKASLQPIGSQ